MNEMNEKFQTDNIAVPIDFLIITPLPEEMNALMQLMPPPDVAEADENFAFYGWCSLTNENAQLVSVVALIPSDTANLPVANLIHNACKKWQPKSFVIVGIAGGIQKINLGDVIVARYIFQWDAKRKHKDHGIELSPVPHDAGTWGVNKANLFISNQTRYENWRNVCSKKALNDSERIIGTIYNPPTLHVDNAATGDAVIDSEESKQQLASIDRKLLIVETEAAGFVSAVRALGNTRILVIRGVSDLAAQKSALDNQSSGFWRRYAAHNACLAMLELLLFNFKNSETPKIEPAIKELELLPKLVLFEVYSKECEPYYIQREADIWISSAAQTHNIWIYGNSGTGKTTSIFRYANQSNSKICYVNLGACGTCSLKDSIGYILDTLSEFFDLPDYKSSKALTVPVAARRMSEMINENLSRIDSRIIIYLDEFSFEENVLSKFIQIIFAVLRQQKSKNVTIFVSTLFHPKEKMPTFGSAHLDGTMLYHMKIWNSEDIIKLIKMSRTVLRGKFSILSQDIENIVQQAQGSPRFIKRFFHHLLLLHAAGRADLNQALRLAHEEV